MYQLSPLEYRQTRAALRDAMSQVLDALDGVQWALSRGMVDSARERALHMARCADDVTALCDRLTRHISSSTS